MSASERSKTHTTRSAQLAPVKTTRRLPWLEGKISQSLTVAVPDDTSTPVAQPSDRPSVLTVPTGNATVHRSSRSASGSSATMRPSRVIKDRMTQTRRKPIAQQEAPHRWPVSQEHLLQVTDCLEGSNSPKPTKTLFQRDGSPIIATPVVVSRVQMSPARPRPGRNAFERTGDRKISNAIEDLEDMVQEAVEIADNAADHTQVEEIYEIIEDARQAIQEASGDPVSHLITTGSPLPASSLSEVASGWDDYGGYSKDPTLFKPEKASPPALCLIKGGDIENTVNLTPQQVQRQVQQETTNVDWAHGRLRSRASISSSSSRSSSDGRHDSRLSTRSDLLLPPEPMLPVTREHVDFVLRPIAREQSRGRPHRRIVRDPTTRSRKHQHHRRPRNRSSSDLRFISRSERQSSLSDESSVEEGFSPRYYEKQLGDRGQGQQNAFSLRRSHRRQPVARNWGTGKKRLAAIIACINTALLGIIIGVYAGEVPRIQYYLADENHVSILGNVVLYSGLALTTCVVWPLPLLHGRKPYVLAALALAMPLQFPQAMVVSAKRSPDRPSFRAGLLCARAATGLVLGFANVNYITVLLDLFGASLQSKNPHQEYVVPNDVRRHGGGMGLWLGIWSWCWIASLAVGFMVGAVIIEHLTPEWGFYIVIMLLAAALVLNIIAPETRRAAYRKSVIEVYDRDENYITRRVSRGECKLHISTEGPKYWFEEVWAGLKLMAMMTCQPGFFVLALYLAWIYAQVVLVIVLLGSLLSRNYKWQPRHVGAGVTSIAVGAFLALPLTKARIFSRERKQSFRTDSMTFQKQVTWSSHLVRRAVFTIALPLMGVAYTVASAGRPRPFMVPIVFAGALGFFSILAIAECHGLIMETFDTCDLQPGVNTKHRLESMAVQDRRRRTNYSSFPRVTAGIFVSQTLAFIGGAVATVVGGIMTRRLGAQTSTGVTAGILLLLTVLLTLVLIRFREIQVIPMHALGTRRDTAAWEEMGKAEKLGKSSDWKAVVIGNPSGKMRRMSVLELGSMSRWTEIRKLNLLLGGRRVGETESGRRPRTWRDGW